MAAAEAQAGGLAAGVRWDLSDLYAGPDDPRIEADLAQALAVRARFAERHRGGVGKLAADELAAAVDELEALGERAARPASYAQLLFAADTSAPRHGALLQRVQERGTEIRNELVFFELEWVGLDDGAARALLADPALAPRRHFLESMRRYRPARAGRVRGEARRGAGEHRAPRLLAPLRRAGRRDALPREARGRDARARRGGGALAPLRAGARAAPRGRARAHRGAAHERAPARLHLQHAGAGQGRRRPPAPLPDSDGLAPPGQRDRRRPASTRCSPPASRATRWSRATTGSRRACSGSRSSRTSTATRRSPRRAARAAGARRARS